MPVFLDNALNMVSTAEAFNSLFELNPLVIVSRGMRLRNLSNALVG